MNAVQPSLVPIPPKPRRYGIPYEGSKHFMAREIVDLLPPAKHFYDLFAGGCAVSHCAALSGKWDHIHVNDVAGEVDLFRRCILGEARRGFRVVDAAEFHERKGEDAFVRRPWSYCGNGRSYLWSSEVADASVLAVRMVLAETWQERRRLWSRVVRAIQRNAPSLDALVRLPPLERIENMLALESLRPLLDRFEFTSLSYEDVPIEDDAVVYCDIPYATADDSIAYKRGFDHEAFYAWALGRRCLWISEYSMPDPFVCVYERPTKAAYGVYASKTKKRKAVVEKIFTPPDNER